MVNVELDKSDLVTLVEGNEPSFELMDHYNVKKCGRYNGSYGTWQWKSSELEKLSELELWELHKRMKHQYK